MKQINGIGIGKVEYNCFGLLARQIVEILQVTVQKNEKFPNHASQYWKEVGSERSVIAVEVCHNSCLLNRVSRPVDELDAAAVVHKGITKTWMLRVAAKHIEPSCLPRQDCGIF